MTRPVILFAHERSLVARAVERVLDLHGMDMVSVASGEAALAVLAVRRFDALVVDVALPDVPGYELGRRAKEIAEQSGAGARICVLVASVYRKTSYKRRPARLYGADDYVELHHLGDMLPDKLRTLLAVAIEPGPEARTAAESDVARALKHEGDARMDEHDNDALASLIVADVILYNGDRILGANDLAQAEAAVADDLEIARDLMAQVARAAGSDAADDSIGRAFRVLMAAMGRTT